MPIRPPGTGKTTTICGLVTRFLTQRPVPSNQTRKAGLQEKPLATKRKILLCAPSNAAIDEIAQRIKDGYTGSQRHTSTVNVVRVGDKQSMNISVRDISLGYLVDLERDVQVDLAPLGSRPSKQKTRQEILTQADIICCTLSGSGHEMLSDIDFDMVIIDEAAQSIELSSLIPLKYGCNRCIMVGDPQQLPPTVLSQEVSFFLLNQALLSKINK